MLVRRRTSFLGETWFTATHGAAILTVSDMTCYAASKTIGIRLPLLKGTHCKLDCP